MSPFLSPTCSTILLYISSDNSSYFPSYIDLPSTTFRILPASGLNRYNLPVVICFTNSFRSTGFPLPFGFGILALNCLNNLVFLIPCSSSYGIDNVVSTLLGLKNGCPSGIMGL